MQVFALQYNCRLKQSFDYSARMTAPAVTRSSYWGLACRGPDIADSIYSDAHPSQIGHINCVLLIGHVS
jgi:hypothetical protein